MECCCRCCCDIVDCVSQANSVLTLAQIVNGRVAACSVRQQGQRTEPNVVIDEGS